MMDGKHDFADFRDEESASHQAEHDMGELMARLDALEKELGSYVREMVRASNAEKASADTGDK
jgi:hypothetical protein